jgi:hypothetical protein
MFIVLAIPGLNAFCQPPPLKTYTVKNGKMYIIMDKKIKEPSLDSFVSQYDIQDLHLKEFIKNGFRDSLQKKGWKVEMDTEVGFVLCKPLYGLDDIDNPANKINFTQKDQTLNLRARFPARNNGVLYGFNQFRNKYPFRVVDSVVTFFLKGHNNARKVMLAGSFNSWNPDALAMTQTDSGWIAELRLGPGKYWYKFIVNGNWIGDNDNRLNENDGLGNVNSVFYKPNTVFTLGGYTNAKRVYLSGSFNDWNPSEILMNKTTTGWTIPVYLAEGTHTYRFVADGNWFADPGNPNRLPNEFGEFNSVVKLGKPYVFKLPGYTDAKKVILSGTFNRWRNDELFMQKTDSGWILPYTLGPGNYEYTVLVDGKKTIQPTGLLIIEPNYTFRLKGFDNARSVYLAGDFNEWNPSNLKMKKEGNEWVYTVHLSAGKHLYKFIIDGKWVIDPNNRLWEQNEHNNANSVIWIEE